MGTRFSRDSKHHNQNQVGTLTSALLASISVESHVGRSENGARATRRPPQTT